MLNYQRVTCFCLSPSGFPLLNGCTTYLPLIHRGMVFFRNLKISEFGVCFFQYIIQYEFRISAQNHRGRKWWSTIAILTCLEVKGCPRRGSCTERSAKGAEAHGSKTFYMAQVGNGRDSSCQGSFLMFSPEKSRFWPNMFKQVMFKQVTSRTSLTFWTRSRPFSPLVSESLICFQFL